MRIILILEAESVKFLIKVLKKRPKIVDKPGIFYYNIIAFDFKEEVLLWQYQSIKFPRRRATPVTLTGKSQPRQSASALSATKRCLTTEFAKTAAIMTAFRE